MRESDVEEASWSGRKAGGGVPGKGGLVDKGTEVEKRVVCNLGQPSVRSRAVETSLKSYTKPQRQ